jgi:hypothetical protein
MLRHSSAQCTAQAHCSQVCKSHRDPKCSEGGQSLQLHCTFGLFFICKRLFSQSSSLGTSRSTSPLE